MSTYIVMAPPGFDTLAGDPKDTDRLVFVPDSFSFPAFLISPVWLLWQRMWLVFLGYLAVTVAIELLALGIDQRITGLVAFLISLLFGFEAQALRRWSLERKGWQILGIVDGRDRAEAELRFLHKEAELLNRKHETAAEPSPPARPAPAPIVPRIGSERVIGLTLGPEGSR